MDSLAIKRTPRAVQLALQNLPTEIGDTYDQAMERIEATNEDDRKIVMNFLQWIVFSNRPLSVAEVEHASCITPDTKDIDQDSILSAGELTSMCAGLVIIDASDIVRLVHFSAQSYFRENRERWFSNGHTALARKCLTYLSYREFKSGPKFGPGEYEDFQGKIERYPLTDYSATYWGFHAAQSPNLADLAEKILDFLQSGCCSFAVQAMWYSDSSSLANWDVRAGIHPMHLAAFFGLDPVISRLLQTHSMVDCKDNLNTTPLMYAAAAGHSSVVQALLREGADPNNSCLRGTTALHQAIIHDHTEVAQHILNVPSVDVNIIDRKVDDRTPLMLAIYYRRINIVPMILRTPGLDINLSTGQSMTTALNLAASYDHPETVRQILALPGVDVDKRDHWSTPLARAATAGFASVVEALLDHGADPNIQEGPNSASGTALNRAIDHGHLAVVRLLLQRGANVRVLDTYDRTIVHSAAVNGQTEILRILFERPTGVDINAQGTNGRTALHDAAYFNYCETVKILVENGARTDIHDGADRSPLGVAKDMNNLEALELLRKYRKQETTRDALDIGPLKHTQSSLDSTQTGFLTAVKLGMKEVVKSYIESSIRDSNVDINLADLDQHSALHIAVLEDQLEILSMLLVCPNIKINALDRLERSALHWSALHCNFEAAELLLDAGADYSIKDHFRETPLDVGLNARFVDTAIVLLERGAMPKEQDTQHALRWAAEFGSVTLVERLVREGGADPARKDLVGMTLVKLAEKGNNLGVVDIIVRLCEEKEKNRAPPARIGSGENDSGQSSRLPIRSS